MSVIRFEDPPTREEHPPTPTFPTTSTRYGVIADELRARPGEWALIVVYAMPWIARNVVGFIRRGAFNAFPAGQFEAVARTVDGKHRVYARYVGSEARPDETHGGAA
jgi:hypothetical protein